MNQEVFKIGAVGEWQSRHGHEMRANGVARALRPVQDVESIIGIGASQLPSPWCNSVRAKRLHRVLRNPGRCADDCDIRTVHALWSLQKSRIGEESHLVIGLGG